MRPGNAGDKRDCRSLRSAAGGLRGLTGFSPGSPTSWTGDSTSCDEQELADSGNAARGGALVDLTVVVETALERALWTAEAVAVLQRTATLARRPVRSSQVEPIVQRLELSRGRGAGRPVAAGRRHCGIWSRLRHSTVCPPLSDASLVDVRQLPLGSSRDIARIVAVGVAFADLAVHGADDVLHAALLGHLTPLGDGFLLRGMSTGRAVPAFDLVLPLTIGPRRRAARGALNSATPTC